LNDQVGGVGDSVSLRLADFNGFLGGRDVSTLRLIINGITLSDSPPFHTDSVSGEVVFLIQPPNGDPDAWALITAPADFTLEHRVSLAIGFPDGPRSAAIPFSLRILAPVALLQTAVFAVGFLLFVVWLCARSSMLKDQSGTYSLSSFWFGTVLSLSHISLLLRPIGSWEVSLERHPEFCSCLRSLA
jgi:hypothetical protein